jgi:hypothetical protein
MTQDEMNTEYIGNEIYAAPHARIRHLIEDIIAVLAIVGVVLFILWVASITG